MVPRITATLALGLAVASLGAQADTLRFEATSQAAGLLGYLEADASVFTPGDAFQFVPNSSLSGLDFSDPQSGLRVNQLSVPGEGAVFDSSGALPVLALGLGQVGGASFERGLWLVGEHGVVLGSASYDDVAWTTARIQAAVPEPQTAALWLAGLLTLLSAARRTAATAAVRPT